MLFRWYILRRRVVCVETNAKYAEAANGAENWPQYRLDCPVVPREHEPVEEGIDDPVEEEPEASQRKSGPNGLRPRERLNILRVGS